MNLYEFLSKLIDSLAWPVVVLAIVVAYRHRIGAVTASLTKLKLSDIELEFNNKIRSAREIIEHSEISEQYNLVDHPDTDDTKVMLERISEASPRSLILESWIGVENALRKVAEHSGIDSKIRKTKSDIPVTRLAAKLEHKGSISIADLESFMILKDIRNEAAHDIGFDISSHSAVEFAIMANKLKGSLLTKIRTP